MPETSLIIAVAMVVAMFGSFQSKHVAIVVQTTHRVASNSPPAAKTPKATIVQTTDAADPAATSSDFCDAAIFVPGHRDPRCGQWVLPHYAFYEFDGKDGDYYHFIPVPPLPLDLVTVRLRSSRRHLPYEDVPVESYEFYSVGGRWCGSYVLSNFYRNHGWWVSVDSFHAEGYEWCDSAEFLSVKAPRYAREDQHCNREHYDYFDSDDRYLGSFIPPSNYRLDVPRRRR